jgi:hypothetical protein
MSFCALLLCVAGAALVYLASRRQALLARPLPGGTRAVAALLLAAGTAAWCTASGPGAGIVAALTCGMLTWVALPYLAWWRVADTTGGTSSR